MDIFSVLSQRLKERREAVGLTQTEAGAAVGVGQAYVSNLENEINRPGVLELVYNLAEEYDISLDYLFGRSEQRAVVKETAPSAATQDVISLLASLPEHRREDMTALADALIRREKSRFAFWLIVWCTDCNQPMTGHIAENGKIYYQCEGVCQRDLIYEEDMIAPLLDTVAEICNRSKAENMAEREAANNLLMSLKIWGRRIGLLKVRQELRPEDAVEYTRTFLNHEDRAAAQAWLQKNFRIYVVNGIIDAVQSI